MRRIAIHDFAGRPHYAPVLAHAREVERCGSFVLLAPKPKADVRELASALERVRFDPR